MTQTKTNTIVRKKEDIHIRAIVYHTYGSPDVLKLEDVQKPIPQDDEVLVKVHAASVNAGDCFLLRGKARLMGFGLLKPKYTILGSDIAGVIEAFGRNVQQFHTGDAVFANTATYGFGGFAEYIAVPETAVVLKPTNISFEAAAAVPQAALTALQGLRDKGHIQKGQQVLINGASGGVGTFAVQLAKAFGAEVTAVCSTGNMDRMRSIGADHVIDYTHEDFTKSGETYDVIFDVVGKSSFSRSVRSLKQNWRYLLANAGLSQMVRGRWTSMRSSKKVILGAASEKTEDLIFLKGLIEGGKMKPIIDRRYPLEQIAEAHRYVEKGHKKGNVVITV